jgi:L-alanine-DL-glutamate epimerase-like enolase superfamily enzyme
MPDYTIVAAEARLARIPVDPPRGDAIQKFSALELPIVRLIDQAGRRGVGFGYTIGAGGSAILALIEDELLPQIVDADPRSIAGLMQRLARSIHALTPGCISSTALAAIDIALWDLAGWRARTPLYLLLGGGSGRIRLYNTHVGWLNRPLEELVGLSTDAVKRDGFTALKLKVGKPDPEEDRERVAKVREAVGRSTRPSRAFAGSNATACTGSKNRSKRPTSTASIGSAGIPQSRARAARASTARRHFTNPSDGARSTSFSRTSHASAGSRTR